MHCIDSLSYPNTTSGIPQSAFGLAAAQFGLLSGVTVPVADFSQPALEHLIETAVPAFASERSYSDTEAEPRGSLVKRAALPRPCTSENLRTMGSLGSPFDAPLPRFQQAAAHLSNSLGQSSSKKPPLSPSLPESKSLKAYDERQERQVLADFSKSKSLERNNSFTRRRYSRNDLAFSQANSLASVLEHSTETDLASLPSSSAPEPTPLLPKSCSMVANSYALSPARSFFSKRLPGLLAATGMLLLLVMSVIALWPPTNGAPIVPRVQSGPATLPQKILNRLFGGSSDGALNMEHFTAAQAAGMGNVGFGLEDSNTPIDESHVADDFESFMSTHLGFEPEEKFGAQEGQSRADFVAAFQRAEAMNDNSAPHGGGYSTDIVTLVAQSSQQPKKDVEGRKELEADTSSTTSTSAGVNSGGMSTGANGGINGNSQAGTQATGLSSASLNADTNTDTSSGKRVGVIPQEQVLPAGSHPLADSSGVADPKNMAGTVTTSSIAAQPQTSSTSSSVGASGGTNTYAQLNSGSTSTSAGTAFSGTFSTPTTDTSSTSGSTTVKSSNSMAGKIAVQPNTGMGVNQGSTAASTNTGGTTASSLRHNANAGSGRATGTVGSNTPLETASSGQVTSVSMLLTGRKMLGLG